MIKAIQSYFGEEIHTISFTEVSNAIRLLIGDLEDSDDEDSKQGWKRDRKKSGRDEKESIPIGNGTGLTSTETGRDGDWIFIRSLSNPDSKGDSKNDKAKQTKNRNDQSDEKSAKLDRNKLLGFLLY